MSMMNLKLPSTDCETDSDKSSDEHAGHFVDLEGISIDGQSLFTRISSMDTMVLIIIFIHFLILKIECCCFFQKREKMSKSLSDFP